MKQNHDSFNSMKKEDSKYGEKMKKSHTVKDHNKKDKYVKNYQNMNRNLK